jgi:hypothetical protein
MAATAPKASRRPVPVVRLMEPVKTGPGHPEADGGAGARYRPGSLGILQDSVTSMAQRSKNTVNRR